MIYKRHKYKAQKVFQHGRYWASKLELAVYEMLLLWQRAGRITDLKCQVKVRFHTHDHGYTNMIPDFSAVDAASGELFYIEAKGIFTREFIRKKKAWKTGGPGALHIYGGRWVKNQSPKVHLMEIVVSERKDSGDTKQVDLPERNEKDT